MKKIISLIIATLFVVLVFTACGENNVSTNTTPQDSFGGATATTETVPAETTFHDDCETTTEIVTTTEEPKTCTEHAYVTKVLEVPGYGANGKTGKTQYTCSNCGETHVEEVPAKTSIRILCIGNSFSVDATEYLGQIFENQGISPTIGNLYIGGCSLQRHASNLFWDNVYEYYYYKNGAMSRISKTKSINECVEGDEWDIITIQQVSQDSGRPETYEPYLSELLNYVNENKLNPDTAIYWHMTWAYQQNSTHSGFVNYNKDQMTMYKAITDTVNSTVLPTGLVYGVIPSGTTIQNLRTSYVGDTVTRDGYHMSYGLGRFAVALQWYKTLTGNDITNFNWVPNGTYPVASSYLDVVKESVNNAYNKPFEVTKSATPTVVVPEKEMTAADAELIKKQGLNPDDYKGFDWSPVLHGYWYSADSKLYSVLISSANSSATNIPNFTSSQTRYTKDQLPVGTIIIVDSGYQYRPEGWKSASSKTDSSIRPGNVTKNFVVVDEAWWGNWTLRAFNLSKTQTAATVAGDEEHLRIYVPKNAIKEPDKTLDDEALFKANNLDIKNYKELSLNFAQGYYNSTSSINPTVSGASNVPNFVYTQTLKVEDLPVGSVIIVDKGYQYRPEGWVSASTKNASGSRPGNVSTNFVVVDSAWWGNFTIRAFNLSTTAGSAIKVDESSHLRIFVPVD